MSFSALASVLGPDCDIKKNKHNTCQRNVHHASIPVSPAATVSESWASRHHTLSSSFVNDTEESCDGGIVGCCGSSTCLHNIVLHWRQLEAMQVLERWQVIKGGWGSECDWGSEILHLEVLLWRWMWRRRRPWWWSRWGSGVVRYFLWCAEWRGSARLRVFGRFGLGRCRSAGAGWACRPAAASAASAPQSELSGQSWHSPVSLTPAEEVGRRRIQLDY